MARISKILCPVDFSEHSQAALEHAAEVARRFGADLTLVHVVEPVLYPVAYGLPRPSPPSTTSPSRASPPARRWTSSPPASAASR